MMNRIFMLGTVMMLVVMPITAHAASALDYYKDWAAVKYGTQNSDKKQADLEKLATQLDALLAKDAKDVEAKIVLATVKSTHASIKGGLSALPLVKDARDLFEEAIKNDEKAMDGQAHAILGALYYGVPGWPVAFGDDDKAERHLKKALSIAPDSIDAHFFWGEFWFEHNKYDRAVEYLTKAVALKPRTSNAAYKAADTGRQAEAKTLLKKAEEKLKSKSSRGSNLND